MNLILEKTIWYKDWQFWLLFLVINMSGNLCFTYIFPYKPILISIFILLVGVVCLKKKLQYNIIIYLLLWIFVLLLQGTYTNDVYSFSSSFHFFIKIAIGCLLSLLLKRNFVTYYSKIIYFFAIVSLICFCYNCWGGVLPYIPVGKTALDGGNIFRVTSVLYTQLYNLSAGGITLRNCGPFWEPGAFQGFLNLSITLQLIYREKENRKWLLEMLILSIAILTTFSTGGYVVLFLNLLFCIYQSDKISNISKIYLYMFLLLIGVFLYISLDFLGEKISNDEGRLGVNFNDLGNGLYFLFGYGLSADSFSQSEIKTASSILNLFRYVGVMGFALYFSPFFGDRISLKNVFFVLLVALILMNEPFITAGPFWWSLPFIFMFSKNVVNSNNVLPFIKKSSF